MQRYCVMSTTIVYKKRDEWHIEWKQVAILANSSFFRIREESKEYPKENPLKNKEDLEEKRDTELTAERSP